MRYKVSFPVFFEKELRKKIVDSFARGIKKSFPTSLLKDEKTMKKAVYATVTDSRPLEEPKNPDEIIVYPGHGPSSSIQIERASNPFVIQQ